MIILFLCFAPASALRTVAPSNTLALPVRRSRPILLLEDERVREGSMDWAIRTTGRVPYGEESRKFRRTVYEHRDWLDHRSTTRLFGNLASTVSSGVVRALLTEVQVVGLVALFVCLWNSLAVIGYTDFAGVHHAPLFAWASFLQLSLPAVPLTLSASSLGLLLVFRTNASYARWLEARMLWGRIVSHSRGIVRQASVWNVLPEGSAERDAEMVQLTASIWAISRCLCTYLRGPNDEPALKAALLARLGAEAAAPLLAAPTASRPVLALRELTATMDAQSIDEKRRVEMDKSVILMMDACEACERIFASPVPLVYTRHTARFLSTYLLLLPLGLYSQFADSWNHVLMIPAASVLAVFLFGIDELAIQLEEPFSILPLEALCEGIDGVNAEMAGLQKRGE